MGKYFKTFTRGLFLFVMTLSFALAPIPRTNLVFAGEEQPVDCYDRDEGGQRIYRPGCGLDNIVQKAEMKRYTEGNSDVLEVLEQAVAGMMSVVLIQSLFYKYRYDLYGGAVYGNDCGSNVAGKYTLRISQLAALSYIIGDIAANTKFKNSSKDFTDTAFADPENHSGEKNAQLRTFDTLIQVLESQKKALKTKQTLSLIAEGGFLASLGLEVAGLASCNAQCGANQALNRGYGTKALTALTTAIAGASSLAVANSTINPVAAAACSTLSAELAAFSTKFGAEMTLLESKDVTVSSASNSKDIAKETFWAGIWASVKSFFTGPAASIVQTISNMPIEEALDDTEAIGKRLASTGFYSGMATTDLGLVNGLVVATHACAKTTAGLHVEAAVKSALNGYINYKYAPIECCGGPGMGVFDQSQLVTNNTALAATVNTLVGEPTVPMALSIAKNKATEEATKKIMDEGIKKFMSGVVSGGVFNPFQFGSLGSLVKGTLRGHGVPPVPSLGIKKDLRVYGIFGGAGGTSSLMDQETKFYVKNGFESFIRRIAIERQMLEMTGNDPRADLKVISKTESKVQRIKHLFNNFIEADWDGKVAFNKMRKTPMWKKIVSEIGDLIVPKSHAFLSSVAVQAAAGVGLSIVSKQLDLKCPWPPF